MLKVHIYLNFDGNTLEAFEFYKSIFGGDFVLFQQVKGTPGIPDLSPEDLEKVMHIALPVGDNMMLHASDAMPSMGQKLEEGNNFHIMLESDSKEEADRYFKALSVHGQIGMPMQDTFWGAYYGMLTDKFGVQWMIDYEYKK